MQPLQMRRFGIFWPWKSLFFVLSCTTNKIVCSFNFPPKNSSLKIGHYFTLTFMVQSKTFFQLKVILSIWSLKKKYTICDPHRIHPTPIPFYFSSFTSSSSSLYSEPSDILFPLFLRSHTRWNGCLYSFISVTPPLISFFLQSYRRGNKLSGRTLENTTGN